MPDKPDEGALVHNAAHHSTGSSATEFCAQEDVLFPDISFWPAKQSLEKNSEVD
ncbi:hypothetical protein [Deinococcus cellulosilyticus]|uniref:hypothetical protein n=1 Tax=Deinococcus cellulosilyticus TaxID=401558 RepID=UPI00164A06CC|nr:hypothetical protein [Deinococcus cellulosilyticus]